jgi:glycosyltransferase involved in cell wall biosynthesis
MITIYTIAYNEAFMLPYFFAHYLNRFDSPVFVVYDNESTDNTADIARAFGAEVRTYRTGNKLSDATYLEIKNKCWMDAKTDWVMLVDIDELCDIDALNLRDEHLKGASIIDFRGYNMVNLEDNLNVSSIHTAVRAMSYDKRYCFNRKYVKEINYGPGGHKCNPVGNIRYSSESYDCWHYKYINVNYMIDRHATFASRLSDDNLKRGYGGHYLYPAENIIAEFEQARKNAIVIK